MNGFSILLSSGEVFIRELDIVSLRWDSQEIILDTKVTQEMVVNWSDFLANDEDVMPQGKYPEAVGKSFLVLFDGKEIIQGIIADYMMLYKPPAATLLYPSQPLIEDKRLSFGIGAPKVEALGEAFLNVFIEEGMASCFERVLNDNVKSYFHTIGKLVQ